MSDGKAGTFAFRLVGRDDEELTRRAMLVRALVDELNTQAEEDAMRDDRESEKR